MSRGRRAFTIVELVVVVAVIVILVGVTLPGIAGSFGAIRLDATTAKLEVLSEAAERYARDTGQAPSSLGALEANVDGAPGWAGPYATSNYSATADDALLDPWSHPFGVRVFASAPWLAGATAFEMRSAGEDGVYTTADDHLGTAELTPTFRALGDAVTAADLAALRASIARYNGGFADGDPLMPVLLKAGNADELLDRSAGAGLRLQSAGLWPRVRGPDGLLRDMLVTDGYGVRYVLSGRGVSVRALSSVAQGL